MNGPGGSGVSPGYESGLPGVTLDDHEHVCVFYRGPEERDTVLSAFFGAGYAEGDKCLCIADDHDVDAVAERLDPHRHRGPDQLTVLPATAYLTDGRFRPKQVYGKWDSMLGAYVEDGYRRVRASGELSWFLRHHRAAAGTDAAPSGPGPLLEYEELCNRLVQRRPATIFCLYDLDLLDAGLLPGVLLRHPTALARGVLFRAPRPAPDPDGAETGGGADTAAPAGHPWRIEERPGGASDALLLAGLLLDGARHPQEIADLLDGIRRAVLGGDAPPGPEGQRFLRALDGLAAPHLRAARLEADRLVRALLDGTRLDPAGEAEARCLGLDLGAPLRAVVVRPPIDQAELAARGITLATAGAGETAFVTGAGANVSDLVAGLAAPGRTVGLGRARPGVEGAARSHAEARRAADFAAGFGRPVLRHEDLGLFSLLADGGDPAAMATLVDEWLGPLLAHDRQRRSGLLPTLAAYLDAGAAQQATADDLGVHVSTLKYRLGRIEEITGRDLSAPDVRFQLQVALAAHRTLTVLHSQGD